MLDRQRDNPCIQIACRQSCDLLGDRLSNHRAGNRRIMPFKSLENRRQDAEGGPIFTTNPNSAFLAAAIAFHFSLGVLKLLKDPFTPLQQHFPGWSKFHTALASKKKLSAELVFKSFDTLTEGRL